MKRSTKKTLLFPAAFTFLALASGCAIEQGDGVDSVAQYATADCGGVQLQIWEGNNWRLSFAEGEVITHEGQQYRANQAISYPNAECSPDAPTSWCAGWFTHLGSCGESVAESCDDGIQNQGESGVDCGGPCDACVAPETCDDGIQNQGESGVDCGGPCDACVAPETCDDGIQNQGESGVDCGGPCDACAGGGVQLPAKIEAEDFDRFEDSTSGHSGDCGSGPVDMQSTSDVGGGCNIGWTKAGEWLEFDVRVTAELSFQASLRLAAKTAGKRVQLSVDGVAVGLVTAPATGWQSWHTESLLGADMSPGDHVVRVTFLDGDVNLNWLSFEEEADPPNWTVDSLSELRQAITKSNQQIVMKPGDYKLTELASGSRNLLFSGSNNDIVLTGVYVEVPVGSTARESYLVMDGTGNTLTGGVFEDTYSTGLVHVTDYYAYNNDGANLSYGLKGAAVFSITGSDNLIDGIKLTVRGSFPYGYGSIYGIGSDNTFGLSKRCGIVIKGQNNTLDRVEIQQRAFCHGIYMQSPADNTTIRNSLVEGVMRLGAELYEETQPDSLPSRSDFKLPHEGDGTQDIPKDVMLPLSEDGIRVYTGGGSVNVENCTVKKMRGGIRLYLASNASVTDSTAIDCGHTNYNMPKGGTVTGSSGNFAYGPLSDFRLSKSNQNLEITIIPSPHATGPHNIADVLGNSHNLVFHRSEGPVDSDETRAIVVSGNNSTIVNETEYRIIVTGSGNDIQSAGPVTNNGTNNKVASIDLEL